jgi:hypothetical protein
MSHLCTLYLIDKSVSVSKYVKVSRDVMSPNGLSRDVMPQNAISRELYCLETKSVKKTETVLKIYINITWILDPHAKGLMEVEPYC